MDDAKEKSQRGAQPGNLNAFKHGEYAEITFPEEELVYRKKMQAFTAQVGKTDPFDDLVIHMLSLISARFDIAMAKHAPPEALVSLSSEILRLLKSFKETRDTRDTAESDEITAFEFIDVADPVDRGSAFSKEQIQIVWELKRDMKITEEQRTEHKAAPCSHCGKNTKKHNQSCSTGICLECGMVTNKPGGYENGI